MMNMPSLSATADVLPPADWQSGHGASGSRTPATIPSVDYDEDKLGLVPVNSVWCTTQRMTMQCLVAVTLIQQRSPSLNLSIELVLSQRVVTP